MSKLSFIRDMSDKEFSELASKCETKQELHTLLGVAVCGVYTSLINTKFISSKAKLKPKIPKYTKIIKKCPVCGNKFSTLKAHKREKTVCSHGCANTYFRSGVNNPNWKESSYRTTCFVHHSFKCVCCEENLLIEVHHYDGNKQNSAPDNLVPLCPTHHQYWHSRHRHLIEDTVNAYIKNFKSSNL